MPNNSKNSINSFSPNFRDALLTRNILTDTVKNSSLDSWLYNINNIADIGDGVGKVKSSPSVEVTGPTYRVENSRFNKNKYISNDYRGFNIPYTSENIVFPSTSYSQYSTLPISSPTTDGPVYNTENTIFNLFKFGDKEYYGNEPVTYENFNVTTNTKLTDLNIKHNPEDDGVYRRELNITQNQFRSSNYERVSLALLPFEVNGVLATLNLNPNTYAPTLEAYTRTAIPASGPFLGGDIRQFGTAKNTYLDVPKQTLINLNTDPVPTGQHTSYIDYNNAFLGGAEATQLVNVIGSALGGGGVGFDPNSGNPVPDFDVRSSLAGRALTATGAIDDTRLGQISPKYLAAAIGNNIAFNIQEETIGRVNTSLASLAGGGSLIAANNRITVGDGFFGGALNIIERMTGAKYPASSLDADIFSYDEKSYIGVPNISRANNMLKNTGSGTVANLFKNINSNTNTGLLGSRSGYAPLYKDNDGDTNKIANLYALEDGSGGVIDVINGGPENAPIPQSSYNLSGVIHNSGFNAPMITSRDGKQLSFGDKTFGKFIWGDDKWNKATKEDSAFSTSLITNSTEKKSLLYKTQQLFNSNNMMTLISGRGVRPLGFDSEITTTSNGFMSKGSGVLKDGGNNIGTAATPDDIFVRAWAPVKAYNQYKDLQKHSALSKDGRFDNVDVDSSVLGLNGIVKIAPHKGDNSEIKKFMFSLENLAWDGETNKLLDCEKGPGDLLTGSKGRIMWFPPYDMVINESTSANWDRTNFIGRGEPIYTYNNSERMGTLGFKIVVDHPNYLNFMKDANDDEIAAFFAGALDIEEIRNSVLNDDEKAAYEVANNNKQVNGVPPPTTPAWDFNVYYPNDVADIDEVITYENGLNPDTGSDIDYDLYPSGIVYKPNTTTIEKAYGDGTTKGEGIVGIAGQSYVDNTNFGLNGIGSPIRVPDASSTGNEDDDTILADGWYDIDSGDSLNDYFTNGNCKYCSIDITGYASPQGNADKNKLLAQARADKLKDYIINTGFLIGLPPDKAEKRIKTNGEALTSTGCVAGVSQDNYICKEDRKVLVKVQYDHSLYLADHPEPKVRDRSEPNPKQQIPLSRFYNECDYFEQIGADDDSFIARDIKSKIKNFHPAFHAITPEGFNSRLTFLQQCMRQGPTHNANTPDNLAFGRPPVCILRIGDFYHTKIIIESLTIDYEPLVWDLNPEGVGVQPMIANINLSFAFIGGSSLKGPINRLQNAISFNYFANTELYDPRAERIRKKTPLEIKNADKDDKAEYTIEEGRFPFPQAVTDRLADEVLDAAARAEFEATKEAEEASRLADISAQEARLAAIENDTKILEFINTEKWYNYDEQVGFDLEIRVGKSPDVEFENMVLSTYYEGELYIVNSKTFETTTIGTLVASPEDVPEPAAGEEKDKPGKMSIVGYSFDGSVDETFFDLDPVSPTFNVPHYGIVNFKLFDHPDYEKIMTLLNPCEDVENIIFNDIFTEKRTPCKDGPHQLILNWKDNDGVDYPSLVTYTLADNSFGGPVRTSFPSSLNS